MLECTRCGWTGAASTLTCPRCGQPFAPPPPRGRPTLLLRLEASDLPSDDFEIADTSQTVGRLDETDIKIPHKSVSRQHARIVPTPTGFEVEDLGSTNGTYLNDRPISDRTPLANNDLLMFGDVPVRVVLRQAPAAVVAAEAVPEPRWAQPQPEPEPQPRPQPASERVASGNGPSTVYYDLDEALAEAQVQPQAQPAHDLEVPTAWDVKPARPLEATPARPLEATPARPLDAAPVQPAAESVEQPTLVGAELVVDPPPPTRDPQPGSSTDPRPRPALDPLPTSAREPLPTPALDPLPTPARDPLPTPREATGGSTSEPRSTPALDPRPTPALDPLPTPALDPRPASALDPRPTPALDPRPTPALDPLPVPARDPLPVPQRATPNPAPLPQDLSATALIDLADQLGAALRQFKGDANLALWLFDHAGGQPAVQAFAHQLARLQRNPDNPQEQALLLEQAPTAARLLEAAVLLANVVSSLGTRAPTDQEPQSNATNLEPIPRT